MSINLNLLVGYMQSYVLSDIFGISFNTNKQKILCLPITR